MKKLLLALILSISTACVPPASVPVVPEIVKEETFKLHGLFNIPWGTPRDKVLEMTGAKLDKDGKGLATIQGEGVLMAYFFEFQDGLLIRGTQLFIFEDRDTAAKVATQCDIIVDLFSKSFGPVTEKFEVPDEGLVMAWTNEDTQAFASCSVEEGIMRLAIQKAGASPESDRSPAALPDGVLEL